MKRFVTITRSYIISFIKNERGAFLIFFAAAVPILFAFGSISINMVEAMNARSRLAQAADEAALTISAINNQNIGNGKQINMEIAKSYFQYYARNQGKLTDINVTYDEEKKTYFVTSNYEAKTLLLSLVPEGKDYVKVGNDRASSGFVRKDIALKSADITFVLDFSSSTTCKISSECNLWSSLSGGSDVRINALKTVMSRMINKYMNHNNVLFAIVPFDLGVPIKPQQAINLTHLPKKNEAGGEQIGCSVPYTLKYPYNKIDFSFWANKYLDFEFKDSIQYEKKYYNRTFYNMDYYRYLYYARVVGPAIGLQTNSSLVSSGICNFNRNGQTPNILYGQYSYSCELDKNQSIFRNVNQEKIKQQYNFVIDLMNLMYEEDNTRSGDFSIANGGSVDFEATLKNIFNKQNIIEFYQPVAPNILGHRPFTGMCQSAQAGPQSLLRDTDEKETEAEPLYERASNLIRNAKNQTYLIPFASNKKAKIDMMNAIQTMVPGGGTDEMSGLLRAAPIVAQGGRGIQKKIIILSDGNNNAVRNLPAKYIDKNESESSLTKVFLKLGVCQIIRNELDRVTRENNGGKLIKPSEIHYVSLDPKRDTYKMWLKYCMNNDKKFIHQASTIDELLNIIQEIIVESETGYFEQKNK